MCNRSITTRSGAHLIVLMDAVTESGDVVPRCAHVASKRNDTGGGADDESNWVWTSMRTNQIKATWRLEDRGWSLYPPGDPAQWDGLLAWFRQVIGKHQPLVERHSLLRRWARP